MGAKEERVKDQVSQPDDEVQPNKKVVLVLGTTLPQNMTVLDEVAKNHDIECATSLKSAEEFLRREGRPELAAIVMFNPPRKKPSWTLQAFEIAKQVGITCKWIGVSNSAGVQDRLADAGCKDIVTERHFSLY